MTSWPLCQVPNTHSPPSKDRPYSHNDAGLKRKSCSVICCYSCRSLLVRPCFADRLRRSQTLHTVMLEAARNKLRSWGRLWRPLSSTLSALSTWESSRRRVFCYTDPQALERPCAHEQLLTGLMPVSSGEGKPCWLFFECACRVIGSELVQKYVGEGARMVRELFEMARCLTCLESALGQIPLEPQQWFWIRNLLSGPKRLVSSSLTRLMQWEELGLTMVPEVTMRYKMKSRLIDPIWYCQISISPLYLRSITPWLDFPKRFKEPCWSWSTSWTALTLAATSRWLRLTLMLPNCQCYPNNQCCQFQCRCWWQQTDQTHLTLPWWGQEGWIGRWVFFNFSDCWFKTLILQFRWSSLCQTLTEEQTFSKFMQDQWVWRRTLGEHICFDIPAWTQM